MGAVSLPLNPIKQNNKIEIPARSIIAMATNGVPAFGPLEGGDSNSVEPGNGFIQDAQFWYGHPTQDGTWHVHNPYMGEEIADSNTLLGWALDGFPIYGPFDTGSDGLASLDNCNGREVDGQYQYHIRNLEDVNENLDYCKSSTNPEVNWNYILGCYHGSTDQTEVADSTSFNIPSDCVEDPDGTAAPTAAPTPCDGSSFLLRLLTDNYGSETTWTLTSNGALVADGGPYGNAQLYEEEECINAGCYVFTIFDSWGDGICCGYGEGNYEVIVDGEVVRDSNGQFDSSESTDFCVEEDDTCTDSGTDIYYQGYAIGCDTVVERGKCDVAAAASHCPNSCEMCDMYGCADSQAPFRVGNSRTLFCTNVPESACTNDIIASTCRETCNYC